MTQFIVSVIPIICLAGCAEPLFEPAPAGDISRRVLLLGFASCPNASMVRERLQEALDRVAGGTHLVYIDQEQLPPDDLRRGWPAPTILVDGRDLFGMAPPQSPSMGCRIYATPDGVPNVEELVERLREAGVVGKRTRS